MGLEAGRAARAKQRGRKSKSRTYSSSMNKMLCVPRETGAVAVGISGLEAGWAARAKQRGRKMGYTESKSRTYSISMSSSVTYHEKQD